jgi:hypothetical protein
MVLMEHICMEDFNGLAASLAAGVSDVRGCLILSRDGLVLGSHPDDGEGQVKPSWMSFAALGDPERGFAQFGTETWCYVRRGPYAAFAVVGLGARPGLVIDHMEQVLLAAEESRNRREGVRAELAAQATAPAPSGKPRTTLHPERPLEEPVVITTDATQAAQASAGQAAAESQVPSGSPAAGAEPAPPANAEPAALPEAPDGDWDAGDGDDEIDRFSLEREFGQLLQDGEDGADG